MWGGTRWLSLSPLCTCSFHVQVKLTQRSGHESLLCVVVHVLVVRHVSKLLTLQRSAEAESQVNKLVGKILCWLWNMQLTSLWFPQWSHLSFPGRFVSDLFINLLCERSSQFVRRQRSSRLTNASCCRRVLALCLCLSGVSRATLSCSLRPSARSSSSQTSSPSPPTLTSCMRTPKIFLEDRCVLNVCVTDSSLAPVHIQLSVSSSSSFTVQILRCSNSKGTTLYLKYRCSFARVTF